MAEVSETKHTVSAVFLLLEYGVGRTPEQLEKKLKHNGVAKGTASKMAAVLKALHEGKITREQVTSLNAAYNLVKAAYPEDQEVKFLTLLYPWTRKNGSVLIGKQDLLSLFRAARRP